MIHSTVSEYFRELIRQDKQREAEARVESLLLQALESGAPTPMTSVNISQPTPAAVSRQEQPSALRMLVAGCTNNSP